MFNRKSYKPQYNYSRLRGKIREVLGTEGEFASQLGRSHNFIVSVFKGNSYFEQKDIDRACQILGIEPDDIGVYFFAI